MESDLEQAHQSTVNVMINHKPYWPTGTEKRFLFVSSQGGWLNGGPRTPLTGTVGQLAAVITETGLFETTLDPRQELLSWFLLFPVFLQVPDVCT